MSQFKVTAESIQGLITEIDNVNGNIKSQISRLKGVADSIAGGWEGTAATAYRNLQNQVNDDATKINNILLSVKEALEGNVKQFIATEESVTQTMKGSGGGSSISNIPT